MNTETPVIDVHAHIHDAAFDDDRTEVMQRMEEAKVSAILVGTDAETSRQALAYADASVVSGVTIGMHPTDHPDGASFDEDTFRALAREASVVAIGECGLDFKHITGTHDEKEAQKRLFETQLELAVEYERPLMIHCRGSGDGEDAHRELTDILADRKREYGERLRGNIHFYTASAEQAHAYIAQDFTVSFSGVVTFDKNVAAVARELPLTMIHAETDCPYAAPVPYRGTRNEPAYVRAIVAKIARVKEMDEEEVAATLRENARRVFGV